MEGLGQTAEPAGRIGDVDYAGLEAAVGRVVAAAGAGQAELQLPPSVGQLFDHHPVPARPAEMHAVGPALGSRRAGQRHHDAGEVIVTGPAAPALPDMGAAADRDPFLAELPAPAAHVVDELLGLLGQGQDRRGDPVDGRDRVVAAADRGPGPHDLALRGRLEPGLIAEIAVAGIGRLEDNGPLVRARLDQLELGQQHPPGRVPQAQTRLPREAAALLRADRQRGDLVERAWSQRPDAAARKGFQVFRRRQRRSPVDQPRQVAVPRREDQRLARRI